MSLRENLIRLRFRYVPDHLLGEVLTKNWIDNTVPFFALIASLLVFNLLIPNFFSAGNLTDATRQLGEFAFVTYAMVVVMLAGGIDLSVGSNFALGNLMMLLLMNIAGWPAWIVIPTVIAICGGVGLLNGVLIGYLRLRAFLTTLATLIIVRAVVDWLLLRYAVDIATNEPDSALRDFIADGMILKVPLSFWVAALFGIAAHIFLSRT